MNKPLILVGSSLLSIALILVLREENDVIDPSACQASFTSPVRSPETQTELVLIGQLNDHTRSVNERMALLKGLPEELTLEEENLLSQLLNQSPPSGNESAAWYVLINETMGKLRANKGTAARMEQILSPVVIDQRLNPVVRDYAVQHLGLWLSGTDVSEEQYDRGMHAFLEVLSRQSEAGGPVVGTILAMVSDLEKRGNTEFFEKHRNPLEMEITAILQSPDAYILSNRLSAIQSSARLSVDSLLPTIRGYAADEQQDPSVRLSSVAALGFYQAQEDLSFLKTLASSHGSLRYAAQEALRKFTE